MSKEDPRLQLVARAICQSHGNDPDREIIIDRAQYRHERGPQWMRYRTQAREHIAAFDALQANAAGDQANG